MNWCVQTPISRQTKWQTQSSAVGCVVYIHIYVYTNMRIHMYPNPRYPHYILPSYAWYLCTFVLWYLHFFEVRSELCCWLKSFILRPDYYIYPINVDQIYPVIFHCHGGFSLFFTSIFVGQNPHTELLVAVSIQFFLLKSLFLLVKPQL